MLKMKNLLSAAEKITENSSAKSIKAEIAAGKASKKAKIKSKALIEHFQKIAKIIK